MPAFTRRTFLTASAATGTFALTGLAAPSVLRAQSTYPSRPINVIIPYATGGYVDRYTRTFAPFLQEAFGQPINVINKSGGDSIIGHQYALQQPKDGYTIISTAASPFIPLSISLHNAPYSLDDFWMINLAARDMTLMAMPSTSKFDTLPEVVAALRNDPSSLSFGVQTVSADNVNMRLLCKALDIDVNDLRIVTYDSGGEVRTALAGGHVDIGLVGAEGTIPIKDQIKTLVVFADERVEGFPDTPTIIEMGKELGFEGEFIEGSQRGWAVPTALKDEAPEIYQTILETIEQVSKQPELIEALEKQFLATTWYGPEVSNSAFRKNAALIDAYANLLAE